MAEENINRALPTQSEIPASNPVRDIPPYHNEPEPEQKAGIFTLIIGVILIARGIMRMNQSGAEIFGVIMLVIGIASFLYYFKGRI